jgi:hypothetical protein
MILHSFECQDQPLTHGLVGLADFDVSYVIASQGEMADAIGFSVK